LGEVLEMLAWEGGIFGVAVAVDDDSDLMKVWMSCLNAGVGDCMAGEKGGVLCMVDG